VVLTPCPGRLTRRFERSCSWGSDTRGHRETQRRQLATMPHQLGPVHANPLWEKKVSLTLVARSGLVGVRRAKKPHQGGIRACDTGNSGKARGETDRAEQTTTLAECPGRHSRVRIGGLGLISRQPPLELGGGHGPGRAGRFGWDRGKRAARRAARQIATDQIDLPPAKLWDAAQIFQRRVTPNDAFFVCFHLAVIPEIDVATWKLSIKGDACKAPLNIRWTS
jgi:hypothetical protein